MGTIIICKFFDVGHLTDTFQPQLLTNHRIEAKHTIYDW